MFMTSKAALEGSQEGDVAGDVFYGLDGFKELIFSLLSRQIALIFICFNVGGWKN